MKVVGVLATKGGVGKTTLTVGWAVEANRRYKGKVAVIDTDPQASATGWRRRRESDQPRVLQAQKGDFEEAVDACREGGMKMVLLDTPPSIEKPALEASREAIQLSDLIIVPCAPSAFDMDAIGITLEMAREGGKPTVIVLTQGRPGSSINDKAKAALQSYGVPICPVTVMKRAAVSDAALEGKAVREVAPKDKGTKEISDSWKWIEDQLKKEN
jgi:chromosome partitioning protein